VTEKLYGTWWEFTTGKAFGAAGLPVLNVMQHLMLGASGEGISNLKFAI
jgi:hypothetical protein